MAAAAFLTAPRHSRRRYEGILGDQGRLEAAFRPKPPVAKSVLVAGKPIGTQRRPPT